MFPSLSAADGDAGHADHGLTHIGGDAAAGRAAHALTHFHVLAHHVNVHDDLGTLAHQACAADRLADLTVSDLLGNDAVNQNGGFDGKLHEEKITELCAFIEGMINYYETEAHVFTHGWLPIVFEGHYPQIDPNWRLACAEDWRLAHELEWQQLYEAGAILKDKTIVCGHRPARMGSMFDASREFDCSEPFFGQGMAAIDAGAVRSGRVNVIVIKTFCE